jgi:2-(1,2-epoxy-1,2-dihydrophenyl)acetyl-CoA isomerase
VPDESLAAEAASTAAALAAGPTLAYASVKRAVAYGMTHGLDESLRLESELMALTGASRDHTSAVQSFLAKENPTFEGR